MKVHLGIPKTVILKQLLNYLVSYCPIGTIIQCLAWQNHETVGDRGCRQCRGSAEFLLPVEGFVDPEMVIVRPPSTRSSRKNPEGGYP